MSTTIIDKMRYQIKWLTQQVECIKEKGCLCFSFETDLTYNSETGELSATFVDDSTRTVIITPASTEAPTLQEVTTQGNTSDNALIITGVNNFPPTEEGLIIANFPGNRAIIGYSANSMQQGNLFFSETQSGLLYPSTSLGQIGVRIREEGTLIQGIAETSVDISTITAGHPRTLVTKEWVQANAGGSQTLDQVLTEGNTTGQSMTVNGGVYSSVGVNDIDATPYILVTREWLDINMNLDGVLTNGNFSNQLMDIGSLSVLSTIQANGVITSDSTIAEIDAAIPTVLPTKEWVLANSGGTPNVGLQDVLDTDNISLDTNMYLDGLSSLFVGKNSPSDNAQGVEYGRSRIFYTLNNTENNINFNQSPGDGTGRGIGLGTYDDSSGNSTDVLIFPNETASRAGVIFKKGLISGEYTRISIGEPLNPEDGATKAYVDANSGGEAVIPGQVAFIFDDGYISHRDVVKPIFDARGIKGGLAMSNRLIEAFQRLRADELQDFQKDGWEILGHSVNHETMNTTSLGIGYKRVEAEVKLNIDQLESYGYNIDGWVTPSSIMDDSFIPALHGRFNYGFTKSNGANPIQDYSDRYKLPRFSLEQNTLLQAQEAADAAIDNNQVIVFYTHDVTAGSQKETDLIAIVDYCITNGYEIVTPREALKKRYDFQNYELDDVTIIEKDINSISLLNATEITTGGIMTVTPDTATSTVLAQATVDLPAYIDVNTQLSFSIDMKLATGITPTCSIGIQFKDSGGAIIRSDEEGTFEMSTFNLRYYVTNNIPEGTTQITYFVRLITDNDATTTYELSAPLLSTGDNILNITQIPVQAADADTLDGLDSSQFLRSDTDATKTAGHLNLSTATQLRFGDSFEALIQQTATDFRLRLNNFDEFRITDGSIGSRLRLYRSTGNLWVSGEAEATSLNLNGGTGFDGILDASTIAANRTWTLPNKSGTIALLDDIAGGISSVVAGTGITVDNTDPDNPIISSTITTPTLQEVTDAGWVTTNGINSAHITTTGSASIGTNLTAGGDGTYDGKLVLRDHTLTGKTSFIGGMMSYYDKKFFLKTKSESGQDNTVAFDLSPIVSGNFDYKTFTLPNKSGTIALLDDITTQSPTLQNVTDNGNSTTNGISVNNILVGDGSVTSPSISFSNEGDVGIYRTGGVFGNGMSFAAEGIERVRISDVSGTLHTWGGVNIGSLGNGGEIRLESSSGFAGGLDEDGGYIVFPSGLGQGRFIFKSPGINHYAQFDQTAMTDERTYTLPNESGTLSLTSDLNNYYDIPTSNGRFMKLVSNETISGLKTFTHPSGAIFKHTAPNIRFEDTDGGTNEKNTMISATGDAWELRFYRDDYSINTAAIRVERVGEQSSSMFFNTPTMNVTGDVVAGGNLRGVDMTLTGDVDGRDFLLNTVSVKSMNPEPASATDTGTLGEIRVTANYIYVCTATNTWKRTPLATW